MKHKIKNTLRILARFFGLKIVFVDYLPDQVHGKLLVREKRILLNAHKPRYEHTFTILHEIGHYTQHVLRPRRKYHPKIFDVCWKIQWLTNLSGWARRAFRYAFNKGSAKEWQADVWAMCAFFYLSIDTGNKEQLLAFIDQHPEKWPIFLLVEYSVFYHGIKTRIKNLGKSLLLPYLYYRQARSRWLRT